MRLRLTRYWICQIAGWATYVLASLFAGYILLEGNPLLLAKRFILVALTAIFYTHLLKIILEKFKLLPPFNPYKLIIISAAIIIICSIYSLTVSVAIERLDLFEINSKVTIGERFLVVMLNDTPCILVWICIFYIWHFIQKIKKDEQNKLQSMIYAQEQERRRISEDLHDNIGSKLFALKLFLQTQQQKLNPNDKEVQALSENSIETVHEVISDVRQILYRLNSNILEEVGLNAAIKKITEKVSETKLLHIDFKYNDCELNLTNEYEIALYRIAQELINNVLKHAKARNALLEMYYINKIILLKICDDGLGFDIKENRNGYGLRNLEARTELLSGKMTINSVLGKGTNIEIRIPYVQLSPVINNLK